MTEKLACNTCKRTCICVHVDGDGHSCVHCTLDRYPSTVRCPACEADFDGAFDAALKVFGLALRVMAWEQADIILDEHMRHVPIALRVRLRKAAQEQRDAEQYGAEESVMVFDVRMKAPDGTHVVTKEVSAKPRDVLASLKRVGA